MEGPYFSHFVFIFNNSMRMNVLREGLHLLFGHHHELGTPFKFDNLWYMIRTHIGQVNLSPTNGFEKTSDWNPHVSFQMRLPSHLKNFHQIVDSGAQHGANKQTHIYFKEMKTIVVLNHFHLGNVWVLHEILCYLMNLTCNEIHQIIEQSTYHTRMQVQEWSKDVTNMC